MSALFDRFFAKVDATGDCWLWTGASNGRYGYFAVEQRTEPAHRISLALTGADVTRGVVHHLCHNSICVNPAHLEVVSQAANSAEHRRSDL